MQIVVTTKSRTVVCITKLRMSWVLVVLGTKRGSPSSRQAEQKVVVAVIGNVATIGVPWVVCVAAKDVIVGVADDSDGLALVVTLLMESGTAQSVAGALVEEGPSFVFRAHPGLYLLEVVPKRGFVLT